MTLPDRSWHAKGNCNQHPDPDIWHYENPRLAYEQKLEVLRSVEAIELCHTCPVRLECLKQGLDAENLEYTGGHGSIWGGLLTVERYLLTTKHPKQVRVKAESRHRKNVRLKIARIDK